MMKIKSFELEDLENEWACHALQGIETIEIKTKNGSFEVCGYHLEETIHQAYKVRGIAAKTAEAIIQFESKEEFNTEENNKLMKLLTLYYVEYIKLINECRDESMTHYNEIKIIRNKDEMLCSFYALRPNIQRRMEEYAETYNRDLLCYL